MSRGVNRGCACALALCVLLAAMLLPGPGLCKDLKIGFVQSERIFEESTDYADAQVQFEKFKNAWEAQAQEMEAEVAALVEEYEQQRLLLSEQKRKEKEREILTKRETLQQFVGEVLSPDGKLAEKNMELSKPIYEKIKAAVAKIGEESQFDLVLDSGAVLWAVPDTGLDLTDRVLEELNKETP